MTQPHTCRLIYITGCDGTGKSTQAKILMQRLQTMGRKPVHVWLRFPFFFSAPLLFYARRKKYSWNEIHHGVRHGYWAFQQSWLMRNLFPWALLLDAALASLGKVYLPLWLGKTIVCERYIVDMLADLEVGLEDSQFHRRLPGKLFLGLIPRGSRVILLDLDEACARNRRADLVTDAWLGKRLAAFRQLAHDLRLPMESSRNAIGVVHENIWDAIS